MRMWAAAGGLSLEKLLEGVEGDLAVRGELVKAGYPAYVTPPEPVEQSAFSAAGRKGGILSREIGEIEDFVLDEDGRMHSISSASNYGTLAGNKLYKAVKELEAK